jgi:hypothetical protein
LILDVIVKHIIGSAMLAVFFIFIILTGIILFFSVYYFYNEYKIINHKINENKYHIWTEWKRNENSHFLSRMCKVCKKTESRINPEFCNHEETENSTTTICYAAKDQSCTYEMSCPCERCVKCGVIIKIDDSWIDNDPFFAPR